MQIQREANGSFGRVLGQAMVGGQPAFIYTADGMTNSLFVRIMPPSRNYMVTIQADIDRSGSISVDETFERIVSTLGFL